jgi:AcrR family transcriptional regulator
MSPRPSVKEERSQQIIEAALKVFAEQGFHQATMDEIAEEAGLSKGALYWYFKGKDKIISTLLQWFFEREYSKMGEWIEAGVSPREILNRTTQLVIDDLLSLRLFMPVMFEFISLSFRNQTVGKVVRESLYGFIEKLTPIFQDGIDSGVFIDEDARDLVYAYGALVEGSILVWSYDMNAINFEQMTKKSVGLYLDGITKKA